MNKLDSTTFDAAPTEQVTFSFVTGTQVSGIVASVDGGAGRPLPVTVVGDHIVSIAVGFTGMAGGSATISIVGSHGGTDQDVIAQVPGVPFRNQTYRT